MQNEQIVNYTLKIEKHIHFNTYILCQNNTCCISNKRK